MNDNFFNSDEDELDDIDSMPEYSGLDNYTVDEVLAALNQLIELGLVETEFDPEVGENVYWITDKGEEAHINQLLEDAGRLN